MTLLKQAVEVTPPPATPNHSRKKAVISHAVDVTCDLAAADDCFSVELT